MNYDFCVITLVAQPVRGFVGFSQRVEGALEPAVYGDFPQWPVGADIDGVQKFLLYVAFPRG